MVMERLQEGVRLLAPHWCCALVAGLLAISLRHPPRWRFSLRELLVIVTIGTLILAVICSLQELGQIQMLAD